MEITGNKADGKSLVQDLCLSGFLIALVLLSTMFINIRLPVSLNGGLIHLGNVPLVLAAIAFGKKKGALAGAFGMGLFDVLGGWFLWAPFTFLIRGAMGYIIGAIAERKDGLSMPLNILAVLAGGVILIAGYYLAEVIIYQNIYAPLTSIPGNAIQVLSALCLGLPATAAVIKHKGRRP